MADRPAPLAQLRLDYPAKPLAAAIEAASHYGLYNLDRVENFGTQVDVGCLERVRARIRRAGPRR